MCLKLEPEYFFSPLSSLSLPCLHSFLWAVTLPCAWLSDATLQTFSIFHLSVWLCLSGAIQFRWWPAYFPGTVSSLTRSFQTNGKVIVTPPMISSGFNPLKYSRSKCGAHVASGFQVLGQPLRPLVSALPSAVTGFYALSFCEDPQKQSGSALDALALLLRCRTPDLFLCKKGLLQHKNTSGVTE